MEDDDGNRGEEKMHTEGSRRLIYIARDQSKYFFRMTAVLDYGTVRPRLNAYTYDTYS